MDTSSSSFSSSPNASSSMFGSFDLEADANPSFPYTPSASGRRWRPRFFCESISGGGGSDAHHFLDTCFLCKKPIAAGDDIFMYRGDAPFCSVECRENQMEMDEALENNRKFSSSSRLKNSSSSSASSTMKHKPSLIIRQNSRNVNAMVAGC